MEELDIAAVTKRSIHGVFALISRTFVIQMIGLVVGLLLAALLSTQDFGVYTVVSAVIAFLAYFSDIGLAGALIQKKEALTHEDLKTTFTIQQMLVVSLVVIALLGMGFVKSFYHLDNAGIFLFQALVISFFLSSLKTIPSILLERDLRFDKLVIPQIVESLVYSVVVLVCALKGYGITSFSLAVLARGLSGLIAIYCIQSWKIGLGISKNVAKRLLSFGIPFQANSLLGLIKDDAMIAYIGKVLPLTEVAYIGFAQKYAYVPLRLVMDNVIRITFPSYSRLQHNENALSKAIEKSIFAGCFLIFPIIVGMVIVAPYLLLYIPKYHKYLPITLSLAFFGMNAMLSSISTPLTNALSAIGKIKVTVNLMVFWTVATWVLTPLFIHMFGFNGFAFASAIISLSVVAVIYITKKYIQFSVLPMVTLPFIGSAIMGLVVYFSARLWAHNLLSLAAVALLGGLVYFVMMYVMARKQLQEDVLLVIKNIKK